MNDSRRRGNAGFTLTELLVVIVIISILSTIALPVYVSRAEDARIAAAKAEVKELALAEEQVAIHHGFYVPLQLLDDIAGGQGVADINSTDDAIGNESTTIRLIDVNQPIDRLDINQPTLADTDLIRVRRLIEDWQGPFMSFQRVNIGDSDTRDPDQLNPTLIQYDHPLDPWGQPYRFYSPVGIIGSNALTAFRPDEWSSADFSDGTVTNTDDRFDRFAIVSYGPDSVPGDYVLGNVSDDIFYEFGSIVLPRNETGFSVEGRR